MHEAVEADPSEMTDDQEPSEPEVDLTPEEAYERAAKEKRRARWAEREGELKKSANDRPSIFGEELEMTVLIYVDTSKLVGDLNHLKVFANADAAEA